MGLGERKEMKLDTYKLLDEARTRCNLAGARIITAAIAYTMHPAEYTLLGSRGTVADVAALQTAA